MPKQETFQRLAKWVKASVWAFPVALLIVLLFLTVFKIHGSSVGIYYSGVHGSSQHDPDLIYGTPKPIRSDEWRIRTPLTVFQVKTGAPTFNEDLGSGRDVAINQEAPIKDWTLIFTPENWAFFIAPLENAFAFKWWFVMFLMITAAYFFILRVLPGKKLLAVILSVSFALSPFLLWWYYSGSFLLIAYALLGVILSVRIIEQEKIPLINSSRITSLIYGLGLAFLGTSFALILYPPFLVPVSIASAAFLVGYIIKRGIRFKTLLRRLMPFGVAAMVVASLVLIFLMGHKEMIHAVSNSVYPGERVIESGGQKAEAVLDGYLMPLLQEGTRGVNYYSNQSEASNFILLLPFLLIPGFVLIWYEYRKHKRVNWTLLLLQTIGTLLLARLYISFGDGFYKLLLLDNVPHNRLLLGLGFVGFLQLLVFIRSTKDLGLKFRTAFPPVAIYGGVCLLVLILFGHHVINAYPKFLDEYLLMIGLAIFFVSIIAAFLLNKRLLGAVLLLIFTLGSSFRILPLYKGLDFFEESDLVVAMERVSKPGDNWVVLDTMKYEALPLAAGRGNVGGPQLYTDLDFWRQIDKDGRHERVYNRQGHAVFLSNELQPDPTKKYNVRTIENNLELVKGNVFKVKFACNEFTYNNIDYVLVGHELKTHPCATFVEKIHYPKTSFYIYRIEPVQQSRP